VCVQLREDRREQGQCACICEDSVPCVKCFKYTGATQVCEDTSNTT